jgi:hypothetical protein
VPPPAPNQAKNKHNGNMKWLTIVFDIGGFVWIAGEGWLVCGRLIFLTHSRRTQRKILNNSVTVPDAMYSEGAGSPLNTDHFAGGHAECTARGAARVWDEFLGTGWTSGLEWAAEWQSPLW